MLNLAGITTRKRYNSNNEEYDPYKIIKLSPQFDINDNEAEERPTPLNQDYCEQKRKKEKRK